MDGSRGSSEAPLECHARSLIDLSSPTALLEHRHRLDAYCPRCDRRAEIDLAAMVAAGLGDRRLPIKVHCRNCCGTGRLHVRPPVPTREAGGWTAPPR